MSLLRSENLHVRIGGIRVVENLDLAVGPGEFWGLLGPNGIGKTTLLKCLAGLDEPAAGQVLLGDQPIGALPRKLLARHLGMLQQHTVYVFDSSVIQTALTGRHPHLGYWEREGPHDVEKAQSALAAVDLEGFAGRSVTGLSGGEARRLAFATLLVQEPDLMLLDEPTNHLDLRHQLRIMRMIRVHAGDTNRSAFCALHDVNLAARYCSHVLMLFGDGEWCAGPCADMLSETSLERLYDCPVERLESATGPRFHPLGS
ncbi:MAG: ABC transporter ATP-binding protein [Xanthomonadales bacterium]|nr:ABC transporter ATP-binding protein [Gammaproteobacteria bacterium]MBT8051172.1 ABC transporter ATP-binding protein [Gammaproteobacteria bacterium]MBT8055975.1 ABC transporter ATP-binding protein [Gammaproteobacteria bacterium]NNL05223.1 ABC transporter ATP-binding protein [Xanthomonadales bacterium]